MVIPPQLCTSAWLKGASLTLILLSIGFMMSGPCIACTIVVKANEDLILVGNNEDYLESRTKIWFRPTVERAHGMIIWGFDRSLWPYQGGMNDKGLFVDVQAINGFTGFHEDPEKPDIPGDEIEYFLSRCASVEEALQSFEKYDIDLGYVKFVFADAHGNSAIVEWLDGKTNVIRREGDGQVSSNVPSDQDHTDPRYIVAEKVLSTQQKPTVALIRRALSATAFAGPFSQTLYSVICDLKKGRVLVYHFHNFEESVTFDLDNELSKGEAEYAIPSLFEIKPYYERAFFSRGPQIGAKDLLEIIHANGVERGIERFHEMSAETRTHNKYVFEEWIIRDVGLTLVSEGRVEDALAIFRLNTQQHPESWEVYYDLAELCAKLGKLEAADRNYRLALEREPDANHVAKINRKLKGGE